MERIREKGKSGSGKKEGGSKKEIRREGFVGRGKIEIEKNGGKEGKRRKGEPESERMK